MEKISVFHSLLWGRIPWRREENELRAGTDVHGDAK